MPLNMLSILVTGLHLSHCHCQVSCWCPPLYSKFCEVPDHAIFLHQKLSTVCEIVSPPYSFVNKGLNYETLLESLEILPLAVRRCQNQWLKSQGCLVTDRSLPYFKSDKTTILIYLRLQKVRDYLL